MVALGESAAGLGIELGLFSSDLMAWDNAGLDDLDTLKRSRVPSGHFSSYRGESA